MERDAPGDGAAEPQSWERFGLIADNSGDVVMLVDLDGVLQWVQASVEDLLGWHPDELVGHRAREFQHPDDLSTMLDLRATLLEQGDEIGEVTLRYLTRDGQYRACAFRGRPRIDPTTGAVVGAILTVRDSSERLATLRALATLSRAGTVLVRSSDEETLVADTCRTIAVSGRYPLSWYLRRGDDGLRAVATSGTRDDFVLDLPGATGTIPVGGAGDRAIDQRATVTVPDVEQDPAYTAWLPALRAHGLRSAVGLPVTVGGHVDGALVVFAGEPNAFDISARELLEDLAATLGYSIGRLRDARDRDELHAITEAERARLRATLDSLFEPLALLAVVRDDEGRAYDLRYVEANDAAVAYNRTTREEMIGRTMLDLFPNVGDEGPLTRYLACAETGEPVVLDDYAFANPILGEQRRYDLRASRTPHGIVVTWRDVTERWRQAQRVAEDERRYRLVAEHGSDVLWETDRQGLLVWASASMARILGWTRDQLVGEQILDLVHPDDLAAAREARARLLGGEPTSTSEYRMRCADGSYRWMSVRADFIGADGGRVMALRDVHDERLGRARLDHLVAHDPVTGAPTRAVLLALLKEHLENDTTVTALLCADVDGLSAVNESVSYAAGDFALAVIADRMADVLGDWDLLGRGSGDELLVLLPGLEDGAVADRVADDLRAAVNEPIDIEGDAVHLTISIGIATAEPGSATDPEQMLRDAGIAMTQAKLHGGDRSAYVDAELSEQAARRLQFERAIREALASGQFHAWLQPIVSLTSSKVHGYEALVRWVHDDGTVVPPADFLPLAERTGLVVDLDKAVLEDALAAVRHLGDGTTVAVNLAAVTLRSEGLADHVLEALTRHGVAPPRLHLEVIETALLDELDVVREQMARIAAAGVLWYVDDFGTGYSSISHLRDLPISGVKLDRSFTVGVAAGDRRCAELSQALVGLADGLGLDSVAEGVETEAVARALAAHGWKHGQGWLFGRPAPAPSSR